MFDFENNKRNLYVIIGIIVLLAIGKYWNNTGELLNLLLTLPAVLIAITFHEFAHAFAADKLGDDTPRRQGRLTLNPFAHLDPVGSLLLIFAGFGWGKPVEINPRNFNRDKSMTASEAIVAIAGPAMNLILAVLFTFIYFAIVKIAPAFCLTQVGLVILTLIQMTIIINIGLGVFNLIPLPPLDGSKVLKLFLPVNVRDWFERNSRIFYIIFVVLWVTDIASIIISPVINAVYKGIVTSIAHLFGM